MTENRETIVQLIKKSMGDKSVDHENIFNWMCSLVADEKGWFLSLNDLEGYSFGVLYEDGVTVWQTQIEKDFAEYCKRIADEFFKTGKPRGAYKVRVELKPERHKLIMRVLRKYEPTIETITVVLKEE